MASVLETPGIMGVSSRAEAAGRHLPAAEDQHEFQEQDDADHRADRRVTLHAGAQFAEVDVEHHDDEQEQDRDGADIDDEQDEGEELGSRDEEQPRRVEEAENEEQHGVDGLRDVTTMTADATRIAAKT